MFDHHSMKIENDGNNSLKKLFKEFHTQCFNQDALIYQSALSCLKYDNRKSAITNELWYESVWMSSCLLLNEQDLPDLFLMHKKQSLKVNLTITLWYHGDTDPSHEQLTGCIQDWNNHLRWRGLRGLLTVWIL